MAEPKNKLVKVIVDAGYHLLNYLGGVDATNYLEIVRTDLQICSLAIVSDHEFFEILKTFNHDQPFTVPEEMYQCYLHENNIIDFRLVPVHPCDLLLKQPIQRLYVHSSFTAEAFEKLSKTYRTSIFQCYSRLLSFNTDFYSANYGLLDYELYAETVGSNRDLNDYEKRFFKRSTFFQVHNNPQNSIEFVKTLNEFLTNFTDRFLSVYWIEAIDFSKFIITGGSVINSLCQVSFSDTHEQDINLIYPSASPTEFTEAVMQCIDNLRNNTLQYSKCQIIVEEIPMLRRYDIHLPCGIKLNFSYISSMEDGNNSLCHILNGFDIDICQVAYTGKQIICTFAFLQAIATKSFVVYSLHGAIRKDVCIRIDKYNKRGFSLLEPRNFDGNFTHLINQTLTPLYRIEHQEIINDDGEVQSLNRIDYKLIWFTSSLAIMSSSTHASTPINATDDSRPLESPVKHKEQSSCATNIGKTAGLDVKFVKASEFASSAEKSAKIEQNEITDEELLQMAVMFENKHLEFLSNVKKNWRAAAKTILANSDQRKQYKADKQINDKYGVL
ncbi:unnamed protein product [Adineta ricciae]|uniref:Uncharacterized protein n=1 Tax=Adineta ricciae TaxID=249248 RepID=A0A815TKY1_ADIRI|nr:unnamed protein product [Adineta ricciae]